jgi:hypothetical protein
MLAMNLAATAGRFLRLLVSDGAIDLHDLKGMREADVLAADCGAGDLVFDYGAVAVAVAVAVAAFRCLGKKGVRPSSLSTSLLSVG